MHLCYLTIHLFSIGEKVWFKLTVFFWLLSNNEQFSYQAFKGIFVLSIFLLSDRSSLLLLCAIEAMYHINLPPQYDQCKSRQLMQQRDKRLRRNSKTVLYGLTQQIITTQHKKYLLSEGTHVPRRHY